MTPIKTILFTTVTLVLLSACTNETEHKSENVFDNKLNAMDEAKKSVEATNVRNEKVAEQIVLTTEPANGSSLYAKKCASCHGSDAKKSALNASKVIAGWESAQTKNALHGYKAGTFGGKMKGIMEGQSRPLSDSEIILISDYISIL